MAEGARVESVDSIRAFRAALWKFAESASVALGDAESEMHRTLVWLETEQPTYWQGQVRKRSEALGRAREALRHKKLFKSPTGAAQSVVDEEKAVAVAARLLEEAEAKLVAVKKHTRQLQKEIDLYKGGTQRLAQTVQVDLPAAAAKLDAIAGMLDEYASGSPSLAQSEATSAAPDRAAGGDGGPSMARPEESAPVAAGPQPPQPADGATEADGANPPRPAGRD